MSAATETAAINRERILQAMPGTTKQIRERTGLTHTTIDTHRKKMQKDGVVIGTKIMRQRPGCPQVMYIPTGKPLTAHIDKPTAARQRAMGWSTHTFTECFFRGSI